MPTATHPVSQVKVELPGVHDELGVDTGVDHQAQDPLGVPEGRPPQQEVGLLDRGYT